MGAVEFLKSVGKDWAWFTEWAKRHGVEATVPAVQTLVWPSEPRQVDGILGPKTYGRMLDIDRPVPVTTLRINRGTPLHGYGRGKPGIVTQVVLHESVDPTRHSTVSTLDARGLSVHYIIDRDGSVTQHLDLSKAGAHAEGIKDPKTGRSIPSAHNEESVAIEFVNRYYGEHLALMQERYPNLYGPGARVIKASWAHKGLYIVPPLVQLEVGWVLLGHVVAAVPTIPMDFPACKAMPDKVLFTWGRWKGHEGADGVMGHARWAHSDSLFEEHYLMCRAAGHSADEAYALTLINAEKGGTTTVPNLNRIGL